MDLFTRLTVCDFLLEKDPLFARLTLFGEELHLYQQIYDSLKPQAPNPISSSTSRRSRRSCTSGCAGAG